MEENGGRGELRQRRGEGRDISYIHRIAFVEACRQVSTQTERVSCHSHSYCQLTSTLQIMSSPSLEPDAKRLPSLENLTNHTCRRVGQQWEVRAGSVGRVRGRVCTTGD